MTTTAWEYFSTAGHSPRTRLAQWTNWGQRAFGSISVHPNDFQGFSGEAARIALGPIVLSVMNFTAADAANPAPEDAPDPEDAIVFSLPQSGSFRYMDGPDTPVEVETGDIYVRDLSRPWALSTRGQVGLVTLRVPFCEFAERLGDPGALVGRRLSGKLAEVACVTGVMRSALNLLEGGAGEPQRAILADTVLDALRLLQTGHPGTDGARDLSLRRKAFLHITGNLGDPDLSPASVARALGVGPRTLQRAFHGSGDTVQGVILDQRLSRAADALRTRANPSRAGVTQIAMTLGFNDAAYFSRAFSRKYGHPPSKILRMEGDQMDR